MFEFEIMHTPGETNQLADALSRLYENDDIKEVPKGEFLEEHLKREDFTSDEDFQQQTPLQPTKAYTSSSLHVEPPSLYHFKPTSLSINEMSYSNGTSSNAKCDANLHWTACLSKEGCPFHYSSTYMETHSAFAPHNDNYDRFYNGLGTDNNGPDEWPDDTSEVSYTGPWYGPDEECPNPEDDPFENYQWLCDNRYLIPTEPGEILEVSPKQFDPASGEKRPKFPAELYAPDGPWWNPSTTGQQTGQLPASQPAIPGLIPTDEPGSLPTEEAKDGPATLHNPQPQRIHQLVLEDVIHDELIADAIVKPGPATAGPSDKFIMPTMGLPSFALLPESKTVRFQEDTTQWIPTSSEGRDLLKFRIPVLTKSTRGRE
jgi:hypothetical protein